MTEVFNWRNAREYIAELNGRELIHLIMWLQYCSENYEDLSADFNGNIKNIPGYIRTSINNAPTKMGKKQKLQLAAHIRNREIVAI